MKVLLFLLFFSGIHAVELIQHSVKISDSITGATTTWSSEKIQSVAALGTTSTNLDSLTDVAITSPLIGQFLSYNSSSSEWKNASFDALRTVAKGDANYDACTSGELAWDADYLYVCTATGAWKRSALTGGY